jgi:DNA-binding transcriptional regulator GbsR (MarR family)
MYKHLTQSDLVKKLGISTPSVSWHIKRLIDFNLISEINVMLMSTYELEQN